MLLIDIHEPESIAEELSKKIKSAKIRLKYGDYSFSDTIIERKTLSDFFSSLKSRRLMEQMESISRFYNDKYLIIEGFNDFSYVNNTDYLFNELFFILSEFGVKLIFSKDEAQTALFIKRLYIKKYFHHSNLAKHDKVYYASKFFGLSSRKLSLILSRFNNIRDLACAEKNDFKGLKGIGKKTIEKINILLDSKIFND